MDALAPLYPKVSDAGYVIVDDYGHFMQCRNAVHDLFDIQDFFLKHEPSLCCVGGENSVPELKYPAWMQKVDYSAVWFRKRDAPMAFK